MKEVLLMYARYDQRANASVAALLDGLTVKARNENRGSYYKSLAGLAKHISGSGLYFQGLFRASVPAAAKLLKQAAGLRIPGGASLTAAQWVELKAIWAKADQAVVDLVQGLGEADLDSPVKLDWYGGEPDSVPLSFLLHQLYTHGTHHRGQVSQILDSLGVEHDFSGIDLEFLPGR